MQQKAGPLLTLRHGIEYALLRIVVALVRLWPVEWGSAAMGSIWRTFAPLSRRYRLAEKQLSYAFPEFSDGERKKVLGEVFENLGRVFAEAMQIERIIHDPDRIEINGLDKVKEVKASGAGLVIMSMHSGNWEIGARLFQAGGYATAAIYQSIRNPYIDAYSRRMRNALYPGGLLPKSAAAARQILSHVKNGGGFAVLADQREHAGIDVPFFGRPAPSTPFPATVARTLNVRLFAGRVIRLKGVRFRFEIEEIPVEHTKDRDTDIRHATAATQTVFEKWIRENPGQWMWGHRRWSRFD